RAREADEWHEGPHSAGGSDEHVVVRGTFRVRTGMSDADQWSTGEGGRTGRSGRTRWEPYREVGACPIVAGLGIVSRGPDDRRVAGHPATGPSDDGHRHLRTGGD